MKDFTTAEYVNPVLEWYRAMYHPITDKTVLDALHCDLLLQRNHGRNARAVRKDGAFFTCCVSALEVYKEIAKYAKAVSIYEDELSDWAWNEKMRFNYAVRDGLLKEYLGKEYLENN